jgi:tetratricopeptide (TPR) repeat protein
MSYFEQRRYKEALLTFDRVILLGSKYPSVRNHAILQKGVTYAIMGEYEEAIKEYRRLTSFELDKKLEIIIHYNLGKLYEKTDLLRNAKDELKTLLNLCQRVNPYERKKIIKAARALSLLQKL